MAWFIDLFINVALVFLILTVISFVGAALVWAKGRWL